MKHSKRQLSIALGVLCFVGCVPFSEDNEKLLCNKWVFGHATLTDRAKYLAYIQEQVIAVARKHSVPQAQIDRAIREIEDQLTEQSINQQFQEHRMSFKDDKSVSMSTKPSGLTRGGAATWTLRGKELTITIKEVDFAEVVELASVSKSQLVLTGQGLTRTYISDDLGAR